MRPVGTGGDIALTPEEWEHARLTDSDLNPVRDLALLVMPGDRVRRYQRYGTTPDGEVLLCPRPVYVEGEGG